MTRLRRFAASAWQARLRIAATSLLLMVMFGRTTVLACPVCFGAEETTVIEGTRLGMLALLALTVAVQGGFAGFFLYLRRRAKRSAEREVDAEWLELQRGASRT